MVKFHVHNLVSNLPNYANHLDPDLLVAEGIAPLKSDLLVTSLSSGKVQVYDLDGGLRASITVNGLNGAISDPTAVVTNSTRGFVVSGASSQWITCTNSGTINAFNDWVNPGVAYVVVNTNTSTTPASYRGLALHGKYLYLADFVNGRVDTYNFQWTPMSFPFIDPTLPTGYSPLNVAVHDDEVYVIYAFKRSSGDDDPTFGAGLGVVSVFTLTGDFLRRFYTGGCLNVPYGFVIGPRCNGRYTDAILIANNGDGMINGFDKQGVYIGTLRNTYSHPITLKGIFGLTVTHDKIFFASAPNDNGLVGSIESVWD